MHRLFFVILAVAVAITAVSVGPGVASAKEPDCEIRVHVPVTEGYIVVSQAKGFTTLSSGYWAFTSKLLGSVPAGPTVSLPCDSGDLPYLFWQWGPAGHKFLGYLLIWNRFSFNSHRFDSNEELWLGDKDLEEAKWFAWWPSWYERQGSPPPPLPE